MVALGKYVYISFKFRKSFSLAVHRYNFILCNFV